MGCRHGTLATQILIRRFWADGGFERGRHAVYPIRGVDARAACPVPWLGMLVEPLYRGYRTEVHAELVDGACDGTVRLRRVLTDDQPHVEGVTCRKVTAELAETRLMIYARRWVDLNGLPPG